MTFSLYPCGTQVKTINGKIEAMITCWYIRFDRISYELAYFANGEQHIVCMNENEFTTKAEKEEVGFAKKKR